MRALAHGVGAMVVQQPDARFPAGAADASSSQNEGVLGPRLPTPSDAPTTTSPETVLVHTTDGPSGVTKGPSGFVEVEISFQPAIFIFVSAPATTVAAELALVLCL